MRATMKTAGDRARGIDFEKGGNLPTPGYCQCPRVRVCALAVGCRRSPVHHCAYNIILTNNWHSGGGVGVRCIFIPL